ncbi:hypothetical protein [Streptomyces sp. NPDC056160]|uniref:hypothetical protein n=1 Tax=Streptomyces sp. NPDC056160 TaxID=3345731 RepID=UPI0035D704EC
MPRRSLICELAVHGRGTEHGAIARILHRPQQGAVWAHWTDGTAPSCTAREVCPRIGDDLGQACELFARHHGDCTFALGNALAEDETRGQRISAALTVLAGHAHHEYGNILEAAHDSLLLSWDELRAQRIWDRLAPWDQAVVYRIMTSADFSQHGRERAVDRILRGSHQLARLRDAGALPGGKEAAVLCDALTQLPAEWQAVVLGGQRAPKRASSTPRVPLGEAVQAAAEDIAAGKTPPEPRLRWDSHWDDVDDRRRGGSEAARLARLPYGWRVDVVRRIAHGVDALTAGHEAAMAVNMLRSYGVYVAWTGMDRL